MPYGITQCYLPTGTGDLPALTPTESARDPIHYWAYDRLLAHASRIRPASDMRGYSRRDTSHTARSQIINDSVATTGYKLSYQPPILSV